MEDRAGGAQVGTGRRTPKKSSHKGKERDINDSEKNASLKVGYIASYENDISLYGERISCSLNPSLEQAVTRSNPKLPNASKVSIRDKGLSPHI